MQQLAVFDQKRVVGNLLGQCMLEDVFDIARRRLLMDEFGALQMGERRFSWSEQPATCRASRKGNSRPMAARVCSSSFSSRGNRSISTANIPGP